MRINAHLLRQCQLNIIIDDARMYVWININTRLSMFIV